MSETIRFTKMVGTGNDFVVVEEDALSGRMNYPALARAVCNRILGIGADGMLLLARTKKADTWMRIFNADGSEAEMCGNGARCAVYYLTQVRPRKKGAWKVTLKTKAGIIGAAVAGDIVKVKLTDPREMKLDESLSVCGRRIKVNSVNTGVPHAVIFVEGIEGFDVKGIAPVIRHHAHFSPRGTNVNLVEPMSNRSIKIRTFERGVEDETLACGTGSTAAALIFALKGGANSPVEVVTKSKETLKVYFTREACGFRDVWLEGKVRIVFTGKFPYTKGR